MPAVKRIKQAFPKIKKIKFEGPDSKNPLSFKYYNEDEVVEGRTMKEHLRFSVVYWHTFRNTLADPFGVGTAIRPWEDGTDSVKNAQNRARYAFEFIQKLGAPYYAFHDRDVAPEGANLAETNANFDAVAKVLKEEQECHWPHKGGVHRLAREGDDRGTGIEPCTSLEGGDDA